MPLSKVILEDSSLAVSVS